MEDEEGLELRRYIGILLRYWWLIVLGPLIVGLGAYWYAKGQPPVYRAETRVLVQASAGSALPSASSIELSTALANAYTEMIRARPVLSATLEELDMALSEDALGGMLSARVLRDTQIVSLGAVHTDPVVAARIANTVAEVFIRQREEAQLAQVARFLNLAAAQGLDNPRELVSVQLGAIGSLSILEPAIPPASPVGPQVLRGTLVAALVGGLVAILVAILLERLRNKVGSSQLVERRFGLATLGTVAQWARREVAPRELVVQARPKSHFAEAFRQLRANLRFVTAPQGMKALLVTSPGPAEGKTTVLANLGVALAQEGKRVVLVDGDLRRPFLHHLFNTSNELGLSSFLADGDMSAQAVMQPTATEGLMVIPAGPRPPNPAELLSSPRLGALLTDLAQEVDMVLVDSPPLLAVADSSLLAAQTQGTLLVADTQTTRLDTLGAAMQSLKKANARVLGVVMDRVKPSRLGYGYGYGYSYYYYYSRYGEDHQPGARANGLPTWLRYPRRWLKGVWGALPGQRG